MTDQSGRGGDAGGRDVGAALALVDAWRSRGDFIDTPDGRVFVVDSQPLGDPVAPPLLILHGFPTSSFDFNAVIDRLRVGRRVVCFDQIGFGLSDKPDRRYGIHLHADTAQQVISAAGLGELDLLSHDMGDSVGGELLARIIAGDLDTHVHRRVVTNGSIYLDLAQLTIGQQLLMGLPDQATEELPVENFVSGVIGTFAAESRVDPIDAMAHGALASNNGGLRLMARLIRYLEDRQREENRYTGAIESHPSPMHVVWGDLDPVAVVAMADRLMENRRSTGHPATSEILDGVGHYPMIEAPQRFVDAVLHGLTGSQPENSTD